MIKFDPLKQLAKYTRDLLAVPECEISLGRINKYDNQSENLIVVDNLSPAKSRYSTKDFDSDKELMKVTTCFVGLFTLDFYGPDSLQRANIFTALNNTEESRTLQKNHELRIFKVGSINNLKRLAGSTYDDRYQIELNIEYNLVHEVDRLRFDTAQFNFLFNE